MRRVLAAWRPTAATINEGDAKNTGANALAVTTINGGVTQEISYGFDAIKYQTQYLVDGAELGSEEASVNAVFVQDRMAFNSGLAIIPGIRYESSSVDSHLVDDSFSAPTGALTIEYQVNDSWLYSVSGTQLFRAPELAEVYAGAGSGDLANSDINAEEGQNLQASIAYEDAHFDMGITVFNTLITDYIYDYAALVGRQYLKDNVGDLRVKGAEIYLGYRQDAWDVLASYSTATSDLSANTTYMEFDGARIDREQGNTFTLAANYHFDDLGLSLHWDSQFVSDLIDGKVLDNTPVENSKAGFGVHNLAARWQPKSVQGLGLTVGIDNLFDEYYASQSSRTGLSLHPLFGELYLMDYEPGRNLKATIAYQL
ncbi:MAG: TonB-dependent receptor [Marinagarivorans sp.]|nr:TonB-dependent receptor [Marinagarivorans sp.]